MGHPVAPDTDYASRLVEWGCERYVWVEVRETGMVGAPGEVFCYGAGFVGINIGVVDIVGIVVEVILLVAEVVAV